MSSKIRIRKTCLQCGEDFIAKTTVTKYCSDKCSKRAYKKRKRLEALQASEQATLVLNKDTGKHFLL